jgi:Antibiotic biosynthesis monooxygenase
MPMKRLYRIDKFRVPAAGREEFLTRVRKTHTLLRKQPGFVRDHVLEHTDPGAGQLVVLTFAEWEGPEAVEKARTAVQAMYADEGFNPHELFARLGIQADLGYYKEVSP